MNFSRKWTVGAVLLLTCGAVSPERAIAADPAGDLAVEASAAGPPSTAAPTLDVPGAPVTTQDAMPTTILVDSGDDVSLWTADASSGATASLSQGRGKSGGAVALSYDLGVGRNHVSARFPVSIDLPENYMFVLSWKAQAEAGSRRLGAAESQPMELDTVERDTVEINTVEIKFVSGDNVWWRRLPDFQIPRDWKDLRVSKQRIEFAWGPAAGGMPEHLDAIEVAIVAGKGGKGRLWIDSIQLEPRRPERVAVPPAWLVSSNSDDAGFLYDKRPTTVWKSAPQDREPSVTIDFREPVEQGGLALDYAPGSFASAYLVEASRDGQQWEEVRRFTRSDGGIDYVYLPEVYARYLRLRWTLPDGAQLALGGIRPQPFSFSSSPNGLFSAIAGYAEPGYYPRYFSGQQSMWTVVGASGDPTEALINEEGCVEVDAGAFSLEPFLWTDDGLRTWREGRHTVSLADGDLPIPTVVRRDGDLDLAITAFASGVAGSSTLYVRYRLTAKSAKAARLLVAIRPFQVLPTWQTLNRTGGVTTISRIARNESKIAVDGRKVVVVTPPSAFGAAAFEEGDISSFLARGEVPAAMAVEDPFEHASAALAWDVSLKAGESRDVWLAVPWSKNEPETGASECGASDKGCPPPVDPDALLEATRQQWRKQLGRVSMEFPGAAEGLVESMRSNLAYVLINRDGPAIQPGSRTYERSWIRDGAMTCGALLELGLNDEVKDFLRWYAGYLGKDGWAPCCVDARGADPVPEHDSFGEFLWAVAEVWRFTRDEDFVREMWPHVQSVAGCMSRLRATRMTPEYRETDRRAYFGLLPESISHEGYAARPVHSYWDQAFALRGYADAALLARVVGDTKAAAGYAAERDSFEETLRHSIAATMIANNLDVVPASVELGDFDPTSTAVSFLLGTEGVYPAGALARSFDRYMDNLRARGGRHTRGMGYTAYELRSATALVLLGRKAAALEMLDVLVADQRPPAWNQWPEISWLWPTEAAFLGDVPHSWIGSTFVHAVRTLLVAEREEQLDGEGASLLVGAGVPRAWLKDGGEVRGIDLPTWYGPLTLRIRSDDDKQAVVELESAPAAEAGAGKSAAATAPRREFHVPTAGIVVAAPFGATVASVRVDGQPARVENDSVRIWRLPATVVFAYQ